MIPTIRHRRPLAAVASVLLLIAVVAPAAIAKDPKTTDIQILALNDFHGQLEVVDPVVSSAGRIGSLQGSRPNQTCIPGGTPNCIPAGGAEYLATHVRDLRAENPSGTVFVTAGDNIGATPLLSALFHDEPTIEALDLMGLDFASVGNHEFDEGIDELLRMQNGGCHPGRRLRRR